MTATGLLHQPISKPLPERLQMKKLFLLLTFFLTGCVRIPDGVQPVDNFNLEKYLGKWYEIARLDHSFERGLSRVTAEYSLREDGGVRVVNRGYAVNEQKWKEVEGKAYFVNESNQGYLKVSFFGPFYGSYIVVALDQEAYNHALVCGPNKSYMWILARTSYLDEKIRDALILKAETLGFDTSQLLFVDHR